ncbi:hypothetical protein RvY_17081 [Ramazzottius varieornatus]|uniref:FH2 domain-containing protein n=1 Tax=Ramazzottius varieornatus TaxID=947166 RepID=A0A1D1W0V0_RAMVA|nr:hypothetical protein RvY_17081 [Ramazzottius varieornatus]
MSSKVQPPLANGSGSFHPHLTTAHSPTKASFNLTSFQDPAHQHVPPDDAEVERRLNDILKSMDLPPDKAKILRGYDSKKKWELICDQERVIVKDAPSVYLHQLRHFVDPKSFTARAAKSLALTSKSKSKSEHVSGTSTQTLRNLETSLRTNNIEWVREFLNEENGGLDVLIDYLASRLAQIKNEVGNGALSSSSSISNGTSLNGHDKTPASSASSPSNGHSDHHISSFAHKSLRLSRSSAAKRLGQPQDDVHVCILCLRAIMNNKFGFNMVICRSDAINYIALSLVHKSLRTKALVLELLAAICLVKGGHEMILLAFDNFKTVHHERHRFQTLMYYFRNYDDFNIDFMVACMQFINIIVHSVEDMNYRVYLQYEFTVIGLDEYLEKLRHHESEELTTQIAAYLDNVFDVTALMKDAEISHAALERVQEVEEQLSHAHERVRNTENAALGQISQLESRINDICRERDDLRALREQNDQELSTLRRTMSQREEESRRRLSELEHRSTRDASGLTGTPAGARLCVAAGGGAAPPPPPPPPPPPNLPLGRRAVVSAAPATPASSWMPPPPPAPPAAPGMAEAPPGALTIKRKVNTKHKLPVLNWIVLKPNQVKGTVFSELDDEKILSSLDFSQFEESFKTGCSGRSMSMVKSGQETALAAGDPMDSNVADQDGRPRFRKVEKVSLLEANRLRNLAIMRRNIELSTEEVVAALNNFDMERLRQDYIEVLLRIMPAEEEIKKYKDYDREKRPVDVLTDEDKFLLQMISLVERLGQKLQIMNFINTFQGSIAMLTPQLQAIFTASRAVKKSDKFRKILELVLAFGNYLNSSRRGPAYGFKLQSLETLLDLKSTDRKTTLLHYIVQTVSDNFPQLLHFDNELIFIDKAAEVSLENVITDIHELDKGMEMTRRECELGMKHSVGWQLLSDFVGHNEQRLSQLQKEQRIAVEAFADAAEYFGESQRTIQPKDFFTSILRFTKAFRAAEEENQQRLLKLREAASAHQSPSHGSRTRSKKNQEAVMSELKNRTSNIKDKKIIAQEEVYHGALEDILLGLKSEPYRRADALRRSQRRREGATLSQAISEFDL